jgi:hypothetical protein
MRVTSGKTGLTMNQKCVTFPCFIFAKVMVSICQQTHLLIPDWGTNSKTPLNERAVFYSSTSMSYTMVKNPVTNMAYNEKPAVMTV